MSAGSSNLQYLGCWIDGDYDIDCHHARWAREDDRAFPACVTDEGYDRVCHEVWRREGGEHHKFGDCHRPDGSYDWDCHEDQGPEEPEAPECGPIEYDACWHDDRYDPACHERAERAGDRKFKFGDCWPDEGPYDWACHVELGGDDRYYDDCWDDEDYDWACHDEPAHRGDAWRHRACRTDDDDYDLDCHADWGGPDLDGDCELRYEACWVGEDDYDWACHENPQACGEDYRYECCWGEGEAYDHACHAAQDGPPRGV